MILLTRPQEQSEALTCILGAENCVIAPMMEIEKLSPSLPDSLQATISTSKNVDYAADISIPNQGKNADDILQYCLNRLHPKDGKVIYLSGDDVTLDIAAQLRANKFDADRVVAYRQVPSRSFDADLKDISIATFFSLNSLKNFKKLAGGEDLSGIACVCISQKVADFAAEMGWLEIHIADEPNLAGMMDAITHIN